MTSQDTPVAALTAQGVAIWLDDISRDRLVSGNLADLVANWHVQGVTSNPTIFQHAVAKGASYDDQIADLKLRHVDLGEAFRALTTYDIRWACDVLRPVYDRTGGRDGRVSIEVDPRISEDAVRTIAEARALWWLVDRPNMFVKIPATLASLPAITACLAEGISINVTLIFSLQRYDKVIDAFMDGLEAAAEAGHDLASIASVASFFVSRMDTEVDRRLDAMDTPQALAVRGKTAVANARLAYELFEQRFATERWQALAAKGAPLQRPLWASTSTKDPSFPDTKYVEELVGPHTVNTMPEGTLKALADHGKITGNTIAGTYDDARKVLADMEAVGIGYDDVMHVLETEAVQKFTDSWNEMGGELTAQLTGNR